MDQEDCLQLRFLKMVNFTGESQLLYHSQSLEPDSLHLTTKYFSPVSHSNIFQIFFKYFSNMSVSQFQSFFSGGFDDPLDNRYLDYILRYDETRWTKVGRMYQKRAYHAVSVINIDDVGAWCEEH